MYIFLVVDHLRFQLNMLLGLENKDRNSYTCVLRLVLLPVESFLFTSALLRMSSVTMSGLPRAQASCKAVLPSSRA